LALLCFGAVSCGDEESSKKSAASADNEASIEVSNLNPAEGSTLTASSTIVATINYSIPNYDSASKNYLVKIWFKNKSGSGYGSSSVSFSSSYAKLTSASATKSFTYSISNEFADSAYVKPLVITYAIHEYSKTTTEAKIDWENSAIAVSDDIIYK
jgi:hypothetical protein